MAKQNYGAKPQTATPAPAVEQEQQTEQTSLEQQTDVVVADAPADSVSGGDSDTAPANAEESVTEGTSAPDTQFEEEVPFEQQAIEQQSGPDDQQSAETLANEETQTAAAVPAEPAAATPVVAQEEQTPVVSPEQAMTTELTASAAARFETEAPQVSSLKQQLAAYIGDMAPGRRMSDSDGGRKQAQLANLLVDSLTQPDPKVFIGCMATWLELITQHRTGVFNERYVFRFASDIPLAKPKQQQWQHLMSVMLAAADGNNLTETVDLQRALLSLGDEFAARFRTYVERRSQR